MSKRKRKPEQKGRFFTFLIYPESAPDEWVSTLDAIDLPMAISPIHDKDKRDVDEVKVESERREQSIIEMMTREFNKSHGRVSKEDGERAQELYRQRICEAELPEYKKEHYHVIYVAKNSVTPSAVRKRVQRSLGNDALAMVQRVDNIGGMYEYLSHTSTSAKDAGKHEYDPEDIIHLNGFDIQKYEKLSTEEMDDMLLEIIGIIKREQLVNVVQLDDFIEVHGEKYGIDNFRAYMITMRKHTYFVTKYFDAVYQNRKSQSYIHENMENLSRE